MEPLITIITPSFQQARFLRACIDSVLNQKYPNLEYLVMDGGSTDGSVEVLKSYGDRIVWSSGPDDGQAAAINAGIRRSRGAILGYLNSDDALLPGALQTVANAFASNPTVDVIYGDAELIDESGCGVGVYPTRAFDEATFFGDCYICQPAAFWRRETQHQAGLLDESLHSALDYEYWIRIARAGGRFLHLEVPLAQSRDYPETKTRSDRTGAFREIFSISRRHLGAIHPRWIEAYLYYVRFETRSWWRGFIPRTENRRKKWVNLIRVLSSKPFGRARQG
ncbi:MAG: glycosyltransferase [Verrucomicrobia bacterium]|nr:MAG: glycosyltransferase [Verrucomicrobiota bacterium]